MAGKAQAVTKSNAELRALDAAHLPLLATLRLARNRLETLAHLSPLPALEELAAAAERPSPAGRGAGDGEGLSTS